MPCNNPISGRLFLWTGYYTPSAIRLSEVSQNPQYVKYDRVSADRLRLRPTQGSAGKSTCRGLLAGSLLLSLLFWAPYSAAQGITLVVSEGAESLSSVGELADRYKEFSKRISIALKRPVTLAPTTRLPALQQALAEARADLAWIRPVNIAADAMATQGYTLVASAEGQFYSAFIVSKNSALKTIKELDGKRVMHPVKNGIIYRMGAAVLGADCVTENFSFGSPSPQETDSVDERRVLGQGDTCRHGSALLRCTRSKRLSGTQGVDKVKQLRLARSCRLAACAVPSLTPPTGGTSLVETVVTSNADNPPFSLAPERLHTRRYSCARNHISDKRPLHG